MNVNISYLKTQEQKTSKPSDVTLVTLMDQANPLEYMSSDNNCARIENKLARRIPTLFQHKE